MIAAAVELTVTVTDDGADVVPGDGVCEVEAGAGNCSLRAAIMESNGLAGPDTVHLPAGTYMLSLAGTGEDLGATGDLDVLDDLDLVGAARSTTVIDGNDLDRVLEVLAGVAVSLDGVTIRNGHLTGSPSSNGAGIINHGTLTATRIVVSENSNGSLSPGGGGIANGVGAALVLRDTWLAGNLVGNASSGGTGGGLHNEGTASLERVTFSDNRATATSFSVATGGGVTNLGTLTLLNVTLTANGADGAMSFGGGIRNAGNLTIESSTFTGNRGSGMMEQSDSLSNDGSATLRHVIFDSNLGDNCGGSAILTSLGFNLDSGSSCSLSAPGDLSDAAAMLGPLSFNGGVTPSHSPLPGSPVIDAGDDGNCPVTDQRGAPRPLDGDGDAIAVCDIGAVEYFDYLFIDPFESGDTWAWSAVVDGSE